MYCSRKEWDIEETEKNETLKKQFLRKTTGQQQACTQGE